MNKRCTILLSLFAIALSAAAQEKIILLNEGTWQADNGRVSYFEDGRIVSNHWFRDVNGQKLGDTPNDIIQVNDSLIAIAVNWSNIIQFITPEGKAVAATEDVPNNRRLASDGKYVYVTSYGHECATEKGRLQFEKGFVAKIDCASFKVTDAVEVGYEPDGMALFDGHLFVGNSGGYAFQENHDYESTVSVLDANTLQTIRTIDTGQINLYGKMSQSGKYLCISSPGDYYEVPAASIILDCQAAIDRQPDAQCFVKLDYAATYSTTDKDGNFFAVGSRYSYLTGEYAFNYLTINPAAAMLSKGTSGVAEDSLPGNVLDDIKGMEMPYGLYVNPYTGYIYATDAGGFVEGGYLYQWNPEGELLGKFGVYINPAHFLALNPKANSSVNTIYSDWNHPEAPIYNLQGIRVTDPRPGQIYIRNGRKFIYQTK